MIRLLTIISALLLSQVASGQKNLVATWGAWGEIGQEYAQYINFGKSFEDSTGYLLLSPTGKLDLFDNNLDKRSSVQIFGNTKDIQILAVSRLSKRGIIVTLEKQQAVKLYKYNSNNKTAEFDKDLILAKKLERVYHVQSPDSSKHLFWTCAPGKSISFYVFDSLFRPQWERIELPVQSPSEWFYKPLVNNNGEVAFADSDKENFLVRVLSDKGKIHKSKSSVLLNNRYVNTVSCMSDKSFAFVLMYNKDNVNFKGADRLQAVCVDANANSLAYSEIPLPTILNDRMAMHLAPIDGYKLRLVTETFTNTIKESNNQCIYGSFNVMGIDLVSSKVLWNKEIFKNLYFVAPPQTVATPFSNDYRTIYGHGFYEYKGILYLFYADNCNNCINVNGELRSQSSMKSSCLAMVSIDKEGAVARHTFAKMPEVKYLVDAASFVQVAPDIVILKNNSKLQRLVAVKLNRLDN